MAQQVVIDIIAETAKLTSGINEANGKLGSLQTQLGGAAQAAVGLASGLILSKGVGFAKDAIAEAVDAEKAFSAANAVFKDTPGLINTISEQADTLGLALGKDNDYLLGLAATIGQRLPSDLDSFSVSLIEVGADIAAASGGAITLDGFISKLSKAFAGGEVEVKKLQKVFPGLTDAVWDQVDALVKQGKDQEAMNLIIGESTKLYGGTAKEQVTATEKIQTAMDSLKEEIGKVLLPEFEKLVDMLMNVIDWIKENKAVVIPLIGVLGGLAAAVLLANAAMTIFNGIQAAMKIVTLASAAATGIFNAVMLANPIALVIVAIAALIAIIITLTGGWENVIKVLGEVWTNITKFAGDVVKKIGEMAAGVGKWLASIFKDFGDTFANIWKDVSGFIGKLISNFLSIPAKLFNVGVDIVKGLWDGIVNMGSWLKDKIVTFFGNLVPSWVKKVFGINSPSKLFASFGGYLVEGLANGINDAADLAKTATMNLAGTTVSGWKPSSISSVGGTSAGVNITINAGLGTDPYQLGKAVTSAVNKYGKVARVV